MFNDELNLINLKKNLFNKKLTKINTMCSKDGVKDFFLLQFLFFFAFKNNFF